MRLIDADAIDIFECHPVDMATGAIDPGEAQDLIDEAPAIEAEPVVHAHWEIMEYQNVIYTATCSNCKIFSNVEHNFEGKTMFYERCPHCGAKMDEK